MKDRIPPWRWSLWGPWPPGDSQRKPPPTDDLIRALAEQLAERRPWCTAEQNWSDASLELQSPLLLRWRPSLLRWLGASEKTGWDWMELSLKLAVPLTISIGGWYLARMNDERQNVIASSNQMDAVIKEYIKEIKGMLLDKEVAKIAKQPGSTENAVARALTLTALSQLKGEGSDRRSLVFQFLRQSNFPILAGSDKEGNEGANLSNYDLSKANLGGANLRKANLFKANLIEANLSRANLSEASLSKANLSKAYLSGANLSEANLGEANLSGADFSGADLSKDYRGKDYTYGIRANLRKANLFKANLSEADIDGADLRGTDLRYADLRWADLDRANLDGADLSGADLRFADLYGANLEGANLDGAELSGARFRETICPNGNKTDTGC